VVSGALGDWRPGHHALIVFGRVMVVVIDEQETRGRGPVACLSALSKMVCG